MISLMAVFSLSAKTLYLAPNDDWKSAGARFAVYAFDNGEEWYSMTAVEGETGLYQAAVDDKYPSVIFCRMNGEAAENNWGNKWNQTQDMTIEADKNLCNISGWDNAGAWGVYTPAGGGENDQMYLWDGIGVTTAAAAKELGGAAEAIQTTGTNIAVGVSQKGNWCLKANKGFSSGAFYLGIALDNAVNAGDTIKVAYFRTTENNSYVLGMDFSADKASATTDYQILSKGDPQVLASNGTPVDSIFIIPEGVANAKYMRIYRNSGSTGLWVAKVQVIKKAAAPEPPAKFYVTGNAALVGEEKQWNPAAIAVTENAYTFENLAAGDYKLKLTLEGDWNTAIGFDAMTDTTAGLYTDADANINFTLSAAANITVNFIKGEQGITTFTVTGSNFASPVVKLMGINADWATGELLVDAEDHKTASKTLTLAAADQDFKIVVVSDWNGWGYEPLETEGSQYEIKRDHNYIDALVSANEPNALKLKADVAGEYTFTYNYVTRKLTVDFPAAPKFYVTGNAALVGEELEWHADAVKSEKDTLVLNLEADKQYMMKLTLRGEWKDGEIRGFDALTEKAEGLVRGTDESEDNIIFSLDEAGQVKVIYIPAAEEQQEVFKLIGNFHIAPVEKDSIFFVNVANWGAVRVHLWGGSAAGTEWPGVEMTLEEEQINGHDVYKLIADKGAYANCIFSDNGNNQTGNLDWNSGKYYYVDAWYAKEEIPTVQPEDVVFTVNVPEGTDSVFIAGTFNGWAFEKMNAVEGQENKYTITKNIVKDGIEYKYTAGKSWDYVEIRDGNRTAWAELDEVTEWKAVPQAPFEKHDFFITGNAALVGEELAWKPNAIPVDGNSYVLHLGAGTYEMKIVLDSCGASNCQQWFGCERLSDEQVEGVACSKVGNIEFALAGEEDVTVTVDLTDTIITLTGNFYNIQMVDIRLVLSPEWAMDNAKFAAVTWRDGQEMENDGVFTGWFVGTGDTVVGQIPEDATQIAFARFAPSVETPFMNPDDDNFWNHSDKLIIEPSMIYTITGGDVPGRNFSPGYWGEKPDFIADGYFLLGTFNEWTPSAAYQFGLEDEDHQRKVTAALAVDDHLKVAEYYRGYHVQWFPAEAGDYIVDADHAGSAQDVYFREDYGGADDWHARCIYVVKNGATAIDNTAIDAKAEKMLRNGMILIIKGDKTYNVMGQIVK